MPPAASSRRAPRPTTRPGLSAPAATRTARRFSSPTTRSRTWQALRRVQAGRVEITIAKRVRHPAERLALQLQEPRVGAESIPAAVDGGDVRGDHLVLRPAESAIAVVHARGSLYGGQEIRPQAHRLEDLGHDADRALRLGGGVELGKRPLGL